MMNDKFPVNGGGMYQKYSGGKGKRKDSYKGQDGPEGSGSVKS